MFRLGIASKDQIPTHRTRRSESAVALTLLSEFDCPLSDDDEARLSLIYEMFGLENGTWMKTYPRRFSVLDEAIESVVGTTFSPTQPIRVREMAASNAITSRELFERLSARFGSRVSLLATDICDALQLAPVRNSRWQVVFDPMGSPRQFIRGRFILAARERPRRYLVNWLILKTLRSRLVAKADRSAARRIDLFHPCSRALAKANSRFKLGREDVLSPDPEPCDILRILNLSHRLPFDPARPWFVSACRLLSDGGLLILGDAPLIQSALAATVFRRQGDRFTVVAEQQLPYEHQEAVLGLRL